MTSRFPMLKHILPLLLFSFLSHSAMSQTMDQNAKSPNPSPIMGGDSKQQKKADKKKEAQKKELEDAIKEGKKQHLSHQERATRRRMRKNKHKADKWNTH